MVVVQLHKQDLESSASALALQMHQCAYDMDLLRARHSLKATLLYNMEELWKRTQADLHMYIYSHGRV